MRNVKNITLFEEIIQSPFFSERLTRKFKHYNIYDEAIISLRSSFKVHAPPINKMWCKASEYFGNSVFASNALLLAFWIVVSLTGY